MAPDLTKEQKQMIFDNYLMMSEIEISIFAKCELQQVRNLINNTPAKKLYKLCRVYNQDKNERGIKFTAIEPEFSKEEIDNLEESISGFEFSTPRIKVKREVINGKLCDVIQSRINYETTNPPI